MSIVIPKKVYLTIVAAAVRFANARIERLIRDAGGQRVSADAIERMNDVLTDIGMQIAKHAIDIARHSGRKTIKENDIKLAAAK